MDSNLNPHVGKSHIVISADSHTEAIVDLKPYLERKYHKQHDRGVEFATQSFVAGVEGFAAHVELRQKHRYSELPEEMDRPVTFEEYAKPMTMRERLTAVDEDGVAAEFITPFVGAFSEELDIPFMHAVTLAHNRFFQDYFSAAPHRFAGASAINLIGGLDMAIDEIEQAHHYGLKAVCLPGRVKENVSRDLPYYNSHFWDPMWQALSDRDMVATVHVGLGREKPLLRWTPGDPGWEIIFRYESSYGVLEAMMYILAGGVFERFPNLKAGYVESGVRWVPPLLNDLDNFVMACPSKGATTKFEMLPSEQWQRQGFVAGMFERDEVELRNEVGLDTLNWGSDFPHVEGTYPHTQAHLARLFANVSEAETQKILAENPARIFGFDLEKLAETPAAKVPWPDPDSVESAA